MEEKEIQKTESISRRELLIGMGAAAIAYSPLSTAMEQEHKHHMKHDHSKHKPQQEDVLNAVNDCVDKGQRCISHCLVAWNEGDLELAACAKKVHEMDAICGGFSYLLTANSGHIKQMASLCMSVCDECAEECRKHDQHHECRACAEACEAVVAAIKKHLA